MEQLQSHIWGGNICAFPHILRRPSLFYVLYSTLLRLPPLRFHCADTRLDLIRTMLDLIRDNTSLMSNNFEEKNENSEVRKCLGGCQMPAMASFDGVSQKLPDPLRRRAITFDFTREPNNISTPFFGTEDQEHQGRFYAKGLRHLPLPKGTREADHDDLLRIVSE